MMSMNLWICLNFKNHRHHMCARLLGSMALVVVSPLQVESELFIPVALAHSLQVCLISDNTVAVRQFDWLSTVVSASLPLLYRLLVVYLQEVINYCRGTHWKALKMF